MNEGLSPLDSAKFSAQNRELTFFLAVRVDNGRGEGFTSSHAKSLELLLTLKIEVAPLPDVYYLAGVWIVAVLHGGELSSRGERDPFSGVSDEAALL